MINDSRLLFQFLSGAIKSAWVFDLVNIVNAFQFLSGAIKRPYLFRFFNIYQKVSIPKWCD